MVYLDFCEWRLQIVSAVYERLIVTVQGLSVNKYLNTN